jgi:hypothetical protein
MVMLTNGAGQFSPSLQVCAFKSTQAKKAPKPTAKDDYNAVPFSSDCIHLENVNYDFQEVN